MFQNFDVYNRKKYCANFPLTFYMVFFFSRSCMCMFPTTTLTLTFNHVYVRSRIVRPSQHRQYMFHELNHTMFEPYQRFDALPQNKSRHSFVHGSQRFTNRYGILKIDKRNVDGFNQFGDAIRIKISIFIKTSNV